MPTDPQMQAPGYSHTLMDLMWECLQSEATARPSPAMLLKRTFNKQLDFDNVHFKGMCTNLGTIWAHNLLTLLFTFVQVCARSTPTCVSHGTTIHVPALTAWSFHSTTATGLVWLLTTSLTLGLRSFDFKDIGVRGASPGSGSRMGWMGWIGLTHRL
jgi:hypothetical protein